MSDTTYKYFDVFKYAYNTYSHIGLFVIESGNVDFQLLNANIIYSQMNINPRFYIKTCVIIRKVDWLRLSQI